MPLRFWIRLAETALALLLAGAVILAWREERTDRAQLQNQLAAANQALAAATARQQDRDAKLSDVLAGIAAEKQAATTPEQLLAGIAREIGLPTPITLQPADTPRVVGRSIAQGSANSRGNSPPSNALQAGAGVGNPPPGSSSLTTAGAPAGRSQVSPDLGQAAATKAVQTPSAPDAKIPASDLQPLYNFVLDCKACQAKLTAAQSDLADEKSKTATLTKSRDDAVRAVKGGSIWQRTTRALKWFAIGAAAGAIAAKSVH